MKSIKKGHISGTDESLKKYEEKRAEIKKLLKQIEAGLEKYDHKASASGGHHWGYVGDLEYIASILREPKDFLHQTGEYAKVGR